MPAATRVDVPTLCRLSSTRLLVVSNGWPFGLSDALPGLKFSEKATAVSAKRVAVGELRLVSERMADPMV
eukprot:scaffold194827_cov35-Tisochrysis_lutea.AAC.1